MGACSHFAVVLLFYRTIVRGMTGSAGQIKHQMEITALIERLDTEKKTIEQKLKLYMGDAEIAENDRYRITWKNSRRFTWILVFSISMDSALLSSIKRLQAGRNSSIMASKKKGQ